MQRVETTCGESDKSETAHTKVGVGIEDSGKGEVKREKRANVSKENKRNPERRKEQRQKGSERASERAEEDAL
jgi:hypothetical protein